MARKRFTGSPINARQQELLQQAEAVEREMARCKRLIAEAPQRRKEEKERQQKALTEEKERERQGRVLRANTRRGPLDGADVVHDVRHENPGVERPTKRRRAQRRAARIKLMVMLVAVMIAGAFVLFLLLQLVQHLG